MIRPHILAVDDDPVVLDLIEAVLTENYCVRATTDPRTALDWLEEDDFDLLLIDLGMPELDGVQVIRRVRSRPHLRNLPIVVLSAYTELRRRLDGMNVQGIIRKPFSLDQFLNTLNDVLKDCGTGRQSVQAQR